MTAPVLDPPWPVERCRTCNASVVRAISEATKKPSVIDANPSPDGNVELVAAELAVLYRIIPAEKREGRTNLHKSHFATCRDAGAWRKRGNA